MDTNETESYTRRGLLRAGAGAATAGAVAAMTTGTASAQAYGGYLDDVDNFDGTADARGLDPVELDVGVGSDGWLFGPTAAVLIEPGTTVEWEWTGRGGGHNVVNEPELVDEPAFDSRPTHEGTTIAEEGFTFEHTFEEEGFYEYVCTPHRGLGMKGVIVVGEDNVEGDLIDFEFDDTVLDTAPIWGGAIAFGLVSFLGVAAYRALVEEGE